MPPLLGWRLPWERCGQRRRRLPLSLLQSLLRWQLVLQEKWLSRRHPQLRKRRSMRCAGHQLAKIALGRLGATYAPT